MEKYNPEGFALQIFKDRYAISSDETFQQACERVARHISDAENGRKRNEYYERFLEILSTNRFSCGGRIWRGSGRPRGQLLNCFHKDTLVITRRGLIPIKDITTDDDVLTIDGTFKKVINKFSQGKRLKLLNINIDRMPKDILMVTEDHKIYTQNGWKEAKNLTDGDFVCTPGYKDVDIPPSSINILDFISFEKERLFIENGFLYKKNSIKGQIKKKKLCQSLINKTITPIKAIINVNKDLMKLLGYYLSEGCAESHGNTLIWTFGLNEKEYIVECKNLIQSIFGATPDMVEHSPDKEHFQGWCQIKLHSRFAHNFMKNWIGESFATKKIPWWFFNLSKECRLTLLAYCCRGDGYHTELNNSNRLTMCNPTLMNQLFMMGSDLQIAYSLSTSKTKEPHHSIPYNVLFSKSKGITENYQEFLCILNRQKMFKLDSYHWKKVVGIQEIDYDDEVFDISVDGNHTLQVMGVVCSNCFSYSNELDSREAWGDALKAITIISGLGGGVGLNFSKVRPNGSPIRGTGGEATGPVSLMRAINGVCNELREGGGRRCLPRYTLIHTKNGLIKIENLKIGNMVQTGIGKYSPVLAIENTGKKKIILINTEMGVFKSSENHRWAVLKNLDGDIKWIEAKDLKPDDRLIFIPDQIEGIPTKLPEYYYNKPKMATTTKDIKIPEFTTDIAWLIGQLHGDGNITIPTETTRASVSIGCAKDLPEQHNRVCSCFQQFGNINISSRIMENEGCSKPRVTSIQLQQYLLQFKTSNKSINVPDFILCGTVDIRCAYIAGILDADGYLGKTNKKVLPQVASSIYPDFLRQLRAVLSSLGIISRIKVSRKSIGNWKKLYKLEIISIESINKFRQLIGRFSEKYKRDGIHSRTKEQNSLTIGDRGYRPISVLGIDYQIEEEETYDIQVQNDQMFVSEGLLSHNSALLFCLNYDHPDILRFLEAKLDNNELTNANISVCIDDQFLKMVRNNDEVVLKWQGEEKQRIKAKHIWDKIINNAWKNAEPGLLNMSMINGYNTISYLTDLYTVNPCLPNRLKVITKNGIRSIKDLSIGDKIWSTEGWTKIINIISRGVKPIYKFDTTYGYLECTKNHKIISDGNKISIEEADTIDTVQNNINFDSIKINPLDIMDGLVLGDGYYHDKKGAGLPYVILCIGKDDQDYFTDNDISHLIKYQCDKSCSYKYRVESTITVDEMPLKPFIKIPDRFYYGKRNKIIGFLRGLYSANGSFTNGRVTLKASSKYLIYQVQHMLSFLGIRSYYTTNKRHNVEFSNGMYECKESYDLNIVRDKEIFANYIGFIQKSKQNKLTEWTVKHQKSMRKFKNQAIIRKTEYIEDIEVFDITVDNTSHTFWCNGFNIANCGEAVLENMGSCCLGSINLHTHFVDGKIDWDLLEETVAIAVRFLDNVLDQNNYPLPEIRQVSQTNRRIGLGIMGLHDLLLELNLSYSTNEARNCVDQLMNFIKKQAYHASIALAIEKGPFQSFDPDKHIKTGFCRKCLTKRHLRLIKEHGIRNCAILSLAPTGTTSLVAGCSSGIEPIFCMAYKLKFNKHTGARDGHEQIILHPLLKKFMQHNRSLIHFENAHEIHPRNHLEMQAVCQKHVDNAISKTINIPSDYPIEQLSIDLLDYVESLKGVTIYRNGSRNSPLTPIPLEDVKKHLNESDIQASIKLCDNNRCET